MKKISLSEVNNYLNQGFLEKKKQIKGSDGFFKTYTILTKKNLYSARLERLIIALAKTIFSLGLGLISRKTRDEWSYAFSKKTLLLVQESKETKIKENIACKNDQIKVKNKNEKVQITKNNPKAKTIKTTLKISKGKLLSLKEIAIRNILLHENVKGKPLSTDLANLMIKIGFAENSLTDDKFLFCRFADTFLIQNYLKQWNVKLPQKILDSCPNIKEVKIPSDFYKWFDYSILGPIYEKPMIKIDLDPWNDKHAKTLFKYYRDDIKLLNHLTPKTKGRLFFHSLKSYPNFEHFMENFVYNTIEKLTERQMKLLTSFLFKNFQKEGFEKLFMLTSSCAYFTGLENVNTFKFIANSILKRDDSIEMVAFLLKKSVLEFGKPSLPFKTKKNFFQMLFQIIKGLKEGERKNIAKKIFLDANLDKLNYNEIEKSLFANLYANKVHYGNLALLLNLITLESEDANQIIDRITNIINDISDTDASFSISELTAWEFPGLTTWDFPGSNHRLVFYTIMMQLQTFPQKDVFEDLKRVKNRLVIDFSEKLLNLLKQKFDDATVSQIEQNLFGP